MSSGQGLVCAASPLCACVHRLLQARYACMCVHVCVCVILACAMVPFFYYAPFAVVQFAIAAQQ
jgi:hypothetical protein